MCPDTDLLSAYLDEELPDDIRRGVTEHLKTCEQCGSVVNRYRRISTRLQEGVIECPSEEIEEAQRRTKILLKRYREVSHPVWKKKVGIGWIAAAASLAFVLGGVTALQIRKTVSPDPMAYLESHPALNITINVKNIQQLLEILNQQEGIREVTIQLPEDPRFEFQSEPIFIRASDYKRSSFR